MITAFLSRCLGIFLAEDDREGLQHTAIAKLDEHDPVPLYRVANACRRLGYEDLWHDGIRLGFGLEHTTHERLYYRGQIKLTLGDWSGWQDLEARHFRPHSKTKSAPWLTWSHRAWPVTENLTGRTLLVYMEGSLGQSIQMLRFISPIAQRAEKVIVAIRPELESFARHNVAHNVVVVPASSIPSVYFDRYVWSLSLPSMYPQLPPFTPFAAPNPARSIPPDIGLQVGVCWTGDDFGNVDRPRCAIPFSTLEPCMHRTGVRWQALCTDSRLSDAEFNSLAFSRLSPQSYADTANLIASLDCVVTTDTAIAHLAGSLGTLTFLLLCADAHYTWGLGDTTTWYPSIRIIRQSKAGDWRKALDALNPQLDAVLSTSSSTTKRLAHALSSSGTPQADASK